MIPSNNVDNSTYTQKNIPSYPVEATETPYNTSHFLIKTSYEVGVLDWESALGFVAELDNEVPAELYRSDDVDTLFEMQHKIQIADRLTMDELIDGNTISLPKRNTEFNLSPREFRETENEDGIVVYAMIR